MPQPAIANPQSTSPGLIIGTANYMSPEQARGGTIDARSDIFSFGIVLYEMLTGRRAFRGENSVDVISAVIHKETTPVSRLLPDVPIEIERIISKALKKDSNERYQTAKDLLLDLRDAKQELEFRDKLGRNAEQHREDAKTPRTVVTTTDAPARPQAQNSSSMKSNNTSAALLSR